jgi:hypothetical protein
MRGWKLGIAGVVILVLSWGGIWSPTSLFAGDGSPVSQAEAAAAHPKTGVGSCTLKGWNPRLDPHDAKNLPEGQRPQTYKPDNYNCTGATFARNGAEFARFPQPHDLRIKNHRSVRWVRVCRAGVCHMKRKALLEAAQASNPLAPYFPPFTHFVIIYRENHTFDDYLGDCATTIQAGLQRRCAEHEPHQFRAQPSHACEDLRADGRLQHGHAAPERPQPLVALLGPVLFQLAAAVVPRRHRDGVRPLPQGPERRLPIHHERRLLLDAQQRQRVLAQPGDQRD